MALFWLLWASIGSAAQAVEVHQYTITVDYSLSQMWVEARFASPVSSVTARSRDAGKYLIDVRSCDSEQSIRLRNRRMMLPEHGISCIKYSVDISRAARSDRSNRDLDSTNVLISPSLWLWRPEVTSRSEIEATFRLPRDVRISVPWRAVDASKNVYRISRSPESSNAIALFGKFDYEEIEVAGARLRISLARGEQPLDKQAIVSWIRATAADISLAYGRFPNPSPQILVIPVAYTNSDSAVPFGRVIRDGGETVQLFVDPERPIADLLADWTATHEFSHLMVPYLSARHRWMSEGFAQYYQNVLMARSGNYDEQTAWQKLYEGFERGRLSRPELSPNEAAAGRVRSGLMKTYWSGAAIALMADVTLRERSNGQESLDSVLGEFQECCLPADRVWSGTEFFSRLDSLLEDPVFMPLYKRYADTAGFPDTEELLLRLGISVNDGTVKLRRNGELVHVRTAITERDASAADWRLQLASQQ